MKQYNDIKGQYPDAMLLFRVGDFYETFGEDAVKASKILGIVLTSRNNGSAKMELAGFPHHSIDTYLPKLVKSGLRVAICDQLEKPGDTKTIVKRGVTELVTPGVVLNDQVLNAGSNNFLASIYKGKKEYGLSLLDISTGEFYLCEGNAKKIESMLQAFKPSEILIQRNLKDDLLQTIQANNNTFPLDEWAFEYDFASKKLKDHFKVKSFKGFGVENHKEGIVASGVVLHYLHETKHHNIGHIQKIARIADEDFMGLDSFTVKNLEIFYPSSPGGVALIDILDRCHSAMGSRLLKRWLALPLKEIKEIQKRHQMVEALLKDEELRFQLGQEIGAITDLERLAAKIAALRINPRELVSLKMALSHINPIAEVLQMSKSPQLIDLAKGLDDFSQEIKLLEESINEEAPVLINKGHVILKGVNSQLDELRSIAHSGKDHLIQIQQREMNATGIPSLKVGFNNVFGYYLEVTHTHKSKVPETWIRKQTLVNAERYITEELKAYETKILGAEEKIQELEIQLFQEVIEKISASLNKIQKNGLSIAKIDCLLSFATIADRHHYCKPELNESYEMDIKQGRHPVIEQNLPVGEIYVPNDVFLDQKSQQIMMITGPNMAGKSALLRQTALIGIMAQIGSFVPAKKASLGWLDRVFTRVGASDNITAGESTFMVEMNETASILNNLSDRSLVLLDEIGRGTSTYDGVSIAWAIAEFLHQNKCKPKTLFATHYHELNDMTDDFLRIKNYHVSVQENNGKIIFLRTLKPGGTHHSFGIHVAEMAGMPKEVLKTATAMLSTLENKNKGVSTSTKTRPKTKQTEDLQLSFFQLNDPVLSQIKKEIQQVDVDNITPVEALMALSEIKKLTGAK